MGLTFAQFNSSSHRKPVNKYRVQSLDNDLGSIGMKCVVSQSCYNVTILQRKFRKMTINSSFVKFHGKKDWEPQHDCYIMVHTGKFV